MEMLNKMEIYEVAGVRRAEVDMLIFGKRNVIELEIQYVFS